MTDPTNRSGDPLGSARALARLLDTAIRIPGTGIRFGLDPILGLVPGLGDVAGAAMSGYIVLIGARLGAPRSIIVRMLLNIGIDTVVGSLPVLGDLFDAAFKSNVRNISLLETFVDRPRETTVVSRAVVAGTVVALLLLAMASVALGVFVLRWLYHMIT
jgi:hypothetical protein